MNLFADDPIHSAAEDQLKRTAFAERVAVVLQKVHEQGESSVVALIGPWGSGKSSELNLIKDVLAEADWAVGEFNPWLLSDMDTLIREYFVELTSLLPADEGTNIRGLLSDYAGAVTPIASGLLGLVGVHMSEETTAALQKILKGDTSLSSRKEKLEVALRKSGKPLLIILDDLDRLEPRELMMVFKLVRLVGRLPNVHYLLSYDERTLISVMTRTDLAFDNDERAHDYLEKIVQVRLDLPPLHSTQQAKLMNEAFDDVVNKNNAVVSPEDEKRIQGIYADVFLVTLDQPRSIKRYFAQVDALFPLVGGEVNFVDFTLITFLRTEFPEVYKLIQRPDVKKELVNSPSYDLGDDEKPEARLKRWRETLAGIKCRDSKVVLSVLSALFVPIGAAWGGGSNNYRAYEDLRRGKRVGSPDYFDRYFQLGIPPDDVSDAEISEQLLLLQHKVSAKKASNWLHNQLTSNPDLLLRKLSVQKETSTVPAKELLLVFGEAYDDLPESSGMFGLDPRIAVVGLSRQLVRQLDEGELGDAVLAILKSKSGLPMLVDLVDTSLPHASKHDAEVIVIDKQIQTFAAQVVSAARNELKKTKTKALTDLGDSTRRLLFRLSDILGPDMSPFVWDLLAENKWPVADFLGWITPITTIYGSGGVRKGIGSMETGTIETFFGTDRLLSELGEALDSPGKKIRDDDEPTLENRRAYTLSVLRDIRAQRALRGEDGQADTEEDASKH